MIVFDLQTTGAARHIPSFLNFLKIKCRFGLGNSIPYKMMFVLATQVKNWGRRCIFSGQSAIFQGRGKTHRSITILTTFKISTQTRIKLLIVMFVLLH